MSVLHFQHAMGTLQTHRAETRQSRKREREVSLEPGTPQATTSVRIAFMVHPSHRLFVVRVKANHEARFHVGRGIRPLRS